jgi:hypothetical protein
MQQIPLSQGKFALVDDEDFETFSQFRWCYRPERNQGPGFAVRQVKIDGKYRLSYLHREIMDPPPCKQVIFLNHDRLDCRRENLKVVEPHEARWYHRVRKDSESGLKGLRYNRSARKWYASITRFGVFYHLGAFDTKEMALQAYQEASERFSQPPAQDPARPKKARPARNEGRCRG